MRDFHDAKAMAQTLRDSLTSKAVTVSHSESLELVSKMLGVRDWNTLSALLQANRRAGESPRVGTPTARQRVEAARYPAIPIRGYVPFPTAVFPLIVGRQKTMAALDQAFKSRREVVLAIQKDERINEPGPQDVHEIGLLGQIVDQEQMDDGTLRVMVEARRRVAIRRFVGEMEAYQADIEDAGEGPVREAAEEVQRILGRFECYAAAHGIHMPKAWPSPDEVRDPGRIADVIAAYLALPVDDKQSLLATLDPLVRLQHIDALMGSSAIPLSAAFEATRRRAIDCATQRNHRYATLEHLLLALLDDADASTVMRSCNVDLTALRADLLNFLGSERENLRIEAGGEARPSPAFRRVRERAQLHAQDQGGVAITGANAFLGLFPETRSPAVRLLDKQGVSSAQVADILARGIGKEG